jgi:hypothetical protein
MQKEGEIGELVELAGRLAEDQVTLLIRYARALGAPNHSDLKRVIEIVLNRLEYAGIK